MVVIIKKGEIVESRILMMKPIDNCVYVLICILSDAGCFDQDETIKAEKSCCAEGTCQKIGRRAGGSVDVSTEGFGP